MISLSKRQALLTRFLYGQNYIDELAEFLQGLSVSTILECGCGDGYILRGLAQKGFSGLGIDSDEEMISLAKQNGHKNIEFVLSDWLELSEVGRDFDLVMCRGGSLGYVSSWGKSAFDPVIAYAKIVESVREMFEHVKIGGILYLDTFSQLEIDRNGGDVRIVSDHIDIRGDITYDWVNRVRYVRGSGTVGGHVFRDGEVSSYLLTITELEEIIKTHHPQVMWRPGLANERFYDVVCARK